MGNSVIDGIVFDKMMRGGLYIIRLYENEINNLNVFPVPDGDTGTNMCRTLELGIEAVHETCELNEYLKGLSSGMLLGAHGNSGVILSQIFKGVCDCLSECKAAGTAEMLMAFTKGYLAAYASVFNPIEGTILTVAREGIENTRKLLDDKAEVELFFEVYLAQMRKTLDTTPEMLPVLKEAGVLDSGGFGYIKIVEGMLKALRNEDMDLIINTASINETTQRLSDGFFDADSDFRYGYCMEFFLQLMSQKCDVEKFSVNSYIDEIKQYGDSLVVIQNKNRVKVHIHTFTPESVISTSRKYGEFLTFKLENMQLQHNEFLAVKKDMPRPHKELAIISVADGDGFKELFYNQGSDMVLNGDRTEGVAVKDFLDAYECVNADNILVLPNDKNIFYVAKQAADMFENGKVEIAVTKDMVQGYFALASDIPSVSIEERILEMREGFGNIVSVCLARTSKNGTCNGVECRTGEYAAFINGNIVLCDADILTATEEILRRVDGIEDREQLAVFIGKNFTEQEQLIIRLTESFPHLNIDCLNGGQDIEDLIIGVI